MIKNSKGITLVSLVITIAVMIIISSITVSTSMDRFEINNLNKMINDIEFLKEKVSNYYLKYNELPVVKDADNNGIEYININFSVDTNDNDKYYIIDLEAMGDIALNYGKEGFENLNSSEDVYIINGKTHNIYYVKGIEWKGEYYHTNLSDNNSNDTEDNIPPTTPQINIISGTEKEEGVYSTNVQIEIIPGKDNWSGVEKTTYTINDETEVDITNLENNILEITKDGEYTIIVRTYDYNKNKSETEKTLELKIEKKFFVKNVQGKILSENENTEVYDEFDNKMILPAGFMITEEADNVTQGLVVTDGINEFVWVPVGEEIKNESKTAKVELGRYADFSLNDNGQYVPVESSDTVINNYYKEEQASTKGNTVAIDLKNGFLKSISKYGGYYIGRYEARADSNKLVSNKNSNVWNYISQTDAADKCRNMYFNSYFKSDLINSYAWDTAIIFIQTFGENKGNYANETSYNSGKLSEKGTDNDKACNIFDMASNCREWTTETCDNKNIADFCHTYRGGYFNVAASLASSRVGNKNETAYNMSFRPILYIELQK